MSTDYRVIYVTIDPADDRRSVTEMMDHECDRQATGGWRLVTAVPDTKNGATQGIWLYFGADLDGDVAETAEVALAEEVIAEAGEG